MVRRRVVRVDAVDGEIVLILAFARRLGIWAGTLV